jgi:hypothetical protein
MHVQSLVNSKVVEVLKTAMTFIADHDLRAPILMCLENNHLVSGKLPDRMF